MTIHQRTLRIFSRAILALMLFMLAVPPAPVQAHASLVHSDPPANAILAQAPKQVRLTFSEALAPSLSSARLLDLQGQQVALKVVGVDPAFPSQLVLELPELGAGVYTVSFRVLSAVDGHFNQGVLVFGVGANVDLAAASGGEQSGWLGWSEGLLHAR